MTDDKDDRARRLAVYMIENGGTVRAINAKNAAETKESVNAKNTLPNVCKNPIQKPPSISKPPNWFKQSESAGTSNSFPTTTYAISHSVAIPNNAAAVSPNRRNSIFHVVSRVLFNVFAFFDIISFPVFSTFFLFF